MLAHCILYNAALKGREVSVLSDTSYLSFRIHCLPAAITLGGTWLLKYNTYHEYICVYIYIYIYIYIFCSQSKIFCRQET